MRRFSALLVLFLLLAALLPALGLLRKTGGTSGTQPAEPAPGAYTGGTLLVLDEATGKVLELSERDYVLGAVMCEMPALWEPEALKAQAVAAHTYALYVKALREAAPVENLKGAYFSVNTAQHEGYLTPDQALALYGGKYAEYSAKIAAAVDAVLPEILTWQGQPISACYHAISPGRTEASENVFGTALPYLVAVDSDWDTQAEGYETVTTYTWSDLADMLTANLAGFAVAGDPEGWFGVPVYSDSGTLLSVELCGRTYTGAQLRAALSLRSAALTFTYADGSFTVTAHGYGHSVGMSQYGAHCLAQEGRSYAEILAHYYPGTELTRLD